MAGRYSCRCHMEKYLEPPSMLYLTSLSKSCTEWASFSILQTSLSGFGSSIFIHVCSGKHSRSTLSCCFLPIDGQSTVRSARLCEVKLKIMPQNNYSYCCRLLHRLPSTATVGLFSCAINHCLVGGCSSHTIIFEGNKKKIKSTAPSWGWIKVIQPFR